MSCMYSIDHIIIQGVPVCFHARTADAAEAIVLFQKWKPSQIVRSLGWLDPSDSTSVRMARVTPTPPKCTLNYN